MGMSLPLLTTHFVSKCVVCTGCVCLLAFSKDNVNTHTAHLFLFILTHNY